MSGKSKIIIPCRLAYVNCWKPISVFGAQRYSVVAIIKKSDKETIRRIREAVDYIKEKSVDKWGGRVPENCHLPLRDGDIEKPDNPVFQQCYFINIKCKEQPQIVDQNVQPIQDPTELYSGCYGKVSVIFYAYSCGGNKGISALLGNIQKVKDGPRLSGRMSASEEFVPITPAEREEADFV